MPPRKLVLAFILLWATTGLALMFASVRTLIHALHESPPSHHLAALAALEALGAFAFLIPPLLVPGGVVLLLTLAVAFVHHAILHEFRPDLLVYVAAVLFVMVHGPVPLGGDGQHRRDDPAHSG